MSPFLYFATSGSGPQVDIAPGAVFNLGPIPITNTILYGWICSLAILLFLIVIARRVTIHPKGGLVQLVEFMAEFVRGMVEGAFFKKEKAKKYVPYFASVFILFLLINWLGLLPFTRGAFEAHSNPLLKPFTADFNATFGAAVVTMGYVYWSSVREAGSFLKYLRHFFVGNPANPLFFLIGLMEMMSDLFRMFSLSLRLFLNVVIGEMIIAVFQWIGSYVGPVLGAPFWLLDAFDVSLQAYIFVILSIMYLAIAVNHNDETEEEFAEEVLKEEAESDKMKVSLAHD